MCVPRRRRRKRRIAASAPQACKQIGLWSNTCVRLTAGKRASRRAGDCLLAVIDVGATARTDTRTAQSPIANQEASGIRATRYSRVIDRAFTCNNRAVYVFIEEAS